MPTTNLKKIYTFPYRSINFQQFFFNGIFCATRILRVIGRRLYDSQPIFLVLKKRKIYWINIE